MVKTLFEALELAVMMYLIEVAECVADIAVPSEHPSEFWAAFHARMSRCEFFFGRT